MSDTSSARTSKSKDGRDEASTAAKKSSEKKQTDDKPQESSKGGETRIGSVLSIILVAALAVVLLGSVVWTLDRRNTMYRQVAALNSELSLAEAENVRLQSELESKISAKNVEQFAEETLKMQKIDPSQIKYIEIQTNDVVSIPQQDEGVMAKIRKFLNRCVEYFRG